MHQLLSKFIGHSQQLLMALAMSIGSLVVSISLPAYAGSQPTSMPPQQQIVVALVPFSDDNIVTSVIQNDLSKTDLKIIHNFLPIKNQNNAKYWLDSITRKSSAISYLVIGQVTYNKGQATIEFEIIDVKTGLAIVDSPSGHAPLPKHFLTVNNDPNSLRYAAHVVADKIYELTGPGLTHDSSPSIGFNQTNPATPSQPLPLPDSLSNESLSNESISTDPLSTDLSSAIVNPLQTQPKAQADSAVSNIMHVISSNLQAPVNSSNDMSVLTLRLDSKGNVLTASAKGSNPALNNAAENAAYKSSPLPIDLRHPDQFRNVIIKIRAN